jgi:hypothetical protein
MFFGNLRGFLRRNLGCASNKGLHSLAGGGGPYQQRSWLPLCPADAAAFLALAGYIPEDTLK